MNSTLAKLKALHPLGAQQKLIWWLHQQTSENWIYHVRFSARIHSELDVRALQRACQTLVDRHEILRTTYAFFDGQPWQQLHEEGKVDFEEKDASNWSLEQLDRGVTQALHHPFDLTRGPMLRVHLFARATGDSILLLVSHIIAVDKRSWALLLEELRLSYLIETNKTASLPPLPERQYTDFANWQKSLLASPKGERHWHYWRNKLAGELPILNLPTDKPRQEIATHESAFHKSQLTQELTEQIKGVAKTEGATLYMVLLAAFFVLLYHHTGQEDILIGSLASGRTRSEFLTVVGNLCNRIVLRADCSGNPPFKAFLTQVRQTVMGALLHQDYPFSLLKERLFRGSEPKGRGLYQVLFNMPEPNIPKADELSPFFIPGETKVRVNFAGLELEPFFLPTGMSPPLDLSLRISEIGGALVCIWSYKTELFAASAIAKIAEHYQTLLAEIVADSQQQIATFSLRG
ncbi:MAG: condensation domain-containing protein [Microcoleaceae cyanobacterium]